jgi:PmbA protein
VIVASTQASAGKRAKKAPARALVPGPADETERQLLEVAQRLVELARKAGAQEAEAFAERTRNASVTVRDGEVEELSQASSKGVGLRVIGGGRLGFASGTDFSKEGLAALAAQAVALSKEAARDPHNALPRPAWLGFAREGAGDYDPAIETLAPEWKLQAARAAEAAARGVDPRVRKFDSTGAGDYLAHSAIASSNGAAMSSRASYVQVYCSPVAEESGQLQTASWSDTRRLLSALDAPGEIGRTAARRAARMLGAKKPKTCKVPVIFDPQMAGSFFAGLASAVTGSLVQKQSSFLAKSLGQRIAPETITLLDDPLLLHGLSTRPFDGEGVISRRNPILERGVLSTFLYDTYYARKSGRREGSTGSASRGWGSLPSIGISNWVVQAGQTPPEELIRSVKSGLYVTAMLGKGGDPVTGDYSRGANGLWIENGELAYPVQEATVAGSLREMLLSIDGVGNDLQIRGSVAAPTIRFAELTVSGA